MDANKAAIERAFEPALVLTASRLEERATHSKRL
jgi:hypothetical protein